MLEQARSGNKEAIAELWMEHRDVLLRFACRFAGGRAEGEDLVQETFVRFLRSLPTLRADSNVRAWLFKVATNLCIDRFKSAQGPSAAAPVDGLAAPNSGPAERAEMADLVGMVQREMCRLPSKYRAALCLRVLQGMSHREVAEMMDDTEANVRWYLFEARKRIYERLKSRLGGIDDEMPRG